LVANSCIADVIAGVVNCLNVASNSEYYDLSTEKSNHPLVSMYAVTIVRFLGTAALLPFLKYTISSRVMNYVEPLHTQGAILGHSEPIRKNGINIAQPCQLKDISKHCSGAKYLQDRDLSVGQFARIVTDRAV
jgi:hypothetical protein